MDCFALTRGRPGTCAARTQLVLLSSIASTSVLSKSRAIGWERVSDDCAMTQILQRVLTGGHSNCPPLALMGSVGALAHERWPRWFPRQESQTERRPHRGPLENAGLLSSWID